LQEVVLEALNINYQIEQTKEFVSEEGCIGICDDFRYKIHPKPSYSADDAAFRSVAYNQVFVEKHGFIENLSIVDLLFNEGPYAIEVLRQSIVSSC